jgi:hypothetical protein
LLGEIKGLYSNLRSYSTFCLPQVWNAWRVTAEESSEPIHEMDLLSGHENDVNYVQFRFLLWFSSIFIHPILNVGAQ